MDHLLQSSSQSVDTDVSGDKHVINFISDERFGLVDLSQRGLESSRTVGRTGKTSGNIHGTSHIALCTGNENNDGSIIICNISDF